MAAIETIRKLEQAGCNFVISVPWIGGVQTSRITAEQAATLLDNPVSVYAEVAGMSVDQYNEWQALGGAVLCRGKTAAGRACRNPIKGGTNLSPDAWKALNDSGGYCAVHGG